MELGLKNKVVLVTGSSRGIGQSIAIEFAREGARVVITGRNSEDVNNTLKQIEKSGGEGLGFVGDLTNENDIKGCVDQIISHWHNIDILVANLGSGKGQKGWEVSMEEWHRLIDLNFMSSVKVSSAVIPHLMKSGGGNIVFIGSISGLVSAGGPPAYEAAKSALISYSKNLSKEVAKHQIRVNVVVPGNILFPGGTWTKN